MGGAVVIGASMAGLLAARTISDRADEVAIIERDDLPDEPEPRKGVPQGRHAHGLLASGGQVLDQLFPGILEDLVARGAVTMAPEHGRIWQRGGYRLVPPGIDRPIMMTRPFLEDAVRQRVLALPNVALLKGTASTPSGNGYWLMDVFGHVYAFGDAHNFGGGDYQFPDNAVAIVPTPTGNGYWVVGAKGSVHTFGDAANYGDLPRLRVTLSLNREITNVVATPSGHGYWMIAKDGGVFAFGDAPFFGSMGATALNQEVRSGAATPTGLGYWLFAGDGGVFAFGDAGFYGSMAGHPFHAQILDGGRTADGKGYWLTDRDGRVFPFGDATFYGSAAPSA
jgi:hypothetical protein